MRAWIPASLAGLLAGALMFTSGASRAPAPAPGGSAPQAFVALGDSLTAGTVTCLRVKYCVDNSWATGTNSAVNSHVQRFLAGHSAIRPQIWNFAEPGARADYLYDEAARAVQVNARFVTILIGANDACAWPMTGVHEFRTEIDQALQLLIQELPKVRVLVVSIPDLYRLWTTTHRDVRAEALSLANRYQCPSLMTNFTSTARADVARRHRVAVRVDAYNKQLAAACHRYPRQCRWDGGKVHGTRFGMDMLAADFFHPNLRGQRKIAQVTAAGRGIW